MEEKVIATSKTTVYNSDLLAMSDKIGKLRRSLQRCEYQNSPEHYALLDGGQRLFKIIDAYRNLAKDSPKTIKRLDRLEEALQNAMYTLPRN